MISLSNLSMAAIFSEIPSMDAIITLKTHHGHWYSLPSAHGSRETRMSTKQVLISSMLLSLALPSIALAQPSAPDVPISIAAKNEVVESLSRQLHSSYVFPEV